MSNEPTIKRWTAKRKAAVVMDIFKGKTTVAELARQYVSLRTHHPAARLAG